MHALAQYLERPSLASSIEELGALAVQTMPGIHTAGLGTSARDIWRAYAMNSRYPTLSAYTRFVVSGTITAHCVACAIRHRVKDVRYG
eukprot:424715-Rhodomonas_salina.2